MLRGDQTFARGRSSSQQSPFIANTLTSMKVYSIFAITIQKCTRHMFVTFSLLNEVLNKKASQVLLNPVRAWRQIMLSPHPIIRMSFPYPLVPEYLVSRSLRVIQHGQSKEHPGFPGWYCIIVITLRNMGTCNECLPDSQYYSLILLYLQAIKTSLRFNVLGLPSRCLWDRSDQRKQRRGRRGKREI